MNPSAPIPTWGIRDKIIPEFSHHEGYGRKGGEEVEDEEDQVEEGEVPEKEGHDPPTGRRAVEVEKRLTPASTASRITMIASMASTPITPAVELISSRTICASDFPSRRTEQNRITKSWTAPPSTQPIRINTSSLR
jgi:hypothetical protein